MGGQVDHVFRRSVPEHRHKASTSLNRFAQGRNAFYQWIHDSLANGKPYNQMATELISASTDNTYNDGPSNFLVGSVVTSGPTQDIMDQMTASTFDTFLGITHVNCLLCHNGRGHLDAVSLWAANTTRYQAWQLSSYMSHTSTARTPVDPSNTNIYYWSLLNNQKNFTTDYTLNTTTGNRPARVAPAGCKAGQPCYTVPPQYIFNGDFAQARRGLSRLAGARDYRRFPIRPRHGELHVGVLLRTGNRGSAGHLRPGAA